LRMPTCCMYGDLHRPCAYLIFHNGNGRSFYPTNTSARSKGRARHMSAPGAFGALNTARSGVSAVEHLVNISASIPAALDQLRQMKSIFAPGGRFNLVSGKHPGPHQANHRHHRNVLGKKQTFERPKHPCISEVGQEKPSRKVSINTAGAFHPCSDV
jgi:hypothetical protein